MKAFKDKPTTLVFTTRFIIKNREPILNIFHHEEDGAWEFTGQTQAIVDTDYNVILLSEMINIDPGIFEVADLPLGYRAFRSSPIDPWQLSPIPDQNRHQF
ncbi:hypothetical protein [Chitinophaga ginsengisoli]|uniref:DUF2185 domain-containing protein n=1 Tax=Chitinophaga ginsengisoli TaxID=363837 RepID=A0A2P8FMQ7_9BACT|nr:hypothetical protein [Chitinophaga ginsengisoli]PSL22983.1 hypothetical protein CLV42_1193 [Chitinophaga ginsengisoli]